MRAFLKKHGGDIAKFASKAWVRLILLAFVCVLTVWAKQFETAETRNLVPAPVAAMFAAYPQTVYLADFAPIITLAITLFLGWLKDEIEADHPDPFTLLNLLDCLATAVGKKTSSRHHKACLIAGHRDVSNYPVHTSTPREQIKSLVDGVHKVFQREALDRGMPQDLQIKVTLAKMDEKRMFQEFWYYFPADLAPTSTGAFRSNKTGFLTTAEKGDVFILDDIKAELQKDVGEQRYFSSRSEAGNRGSIICFPIIIDAIRGYPTVPFVLTIKCDTPKTFCEARKRRYAILAKPFIERIKLEFYNHIIASQGEDYHGDHSPTPGGKNLAGVTERSRRAKAKSRTSVQSSESD